MGEALHENTRYLSPLSMRDLLARVREIGKQFKIISLHRQIEACESLIGEDKHIDVAVLGQFKAGKSSFLNSLVGDGILPIGAIPVTTTISRLQYGAKARVVVRHFDGRVNEVDPQEIEDFTSEARNPANEKNVEVVDIELPSLKRYSGLRFVDTPGLGSVFKYHRETSANWLPEVGAALVAISAERPLAENDLQLIRDLKQHTPKIILLLTKADLLSSEQQTEVIQFFRKTLRREFEQEFPIFLYSTRTGLELWRRRLEEELLFQLAANRKAEIKSIQEHKIRSLVKACLNYLEIALQTSRKADLDRDELRRLILDEKVNYDLIRDEMARIVRENMHHTRELIWKRLEDGPLPVLRKKVKEKLAGEMPSWRENLWKLTRHYEAWLEETLTDELTRVSKTEYRNFLGTRHKAYASISRSLEIFRTLLEGNVERVLGVKLAEADWNIEVAEPTQPDIKTSRTFDYHVDLLWFLIPMFIFRRVFERHYLSQIDGEVEVNLSRLAAQWEERINRSIEGMKKQALAYVQDELATIEALLSRPQGQTNEIREIMGELKRQSEALIN